MNCYVSTCSVRSTQADGKHVEFSLAQLSFTFRNPKANSLNEDIEVQVFRQNAVKVYKLRYHYPRAGQP